MQRKGKGDSDNMFLSLIMLADKVCSCFSDGNSKPAEQSGCKQLGVWSLLTGRESWGRAGG
jgi:hypothetical protein